ncbi:hypothetical protein A2U01_0074166, partial [Trifolium medium]|nr:hypothetical protein [Trifolium medium]
MMKVVGFSWFPARTRLRRATQWGIRINEERITMIERLIDMEGIDNRPKQAAGDE